MANKNPRDHFLAIFDIWIPFWLIPWGNLFQGIYLSPQIRIGLKASMKNVCLHITFSTIAWELLDKLIVSQGTPSLLLVLPSILTRMMQFLRLSPRPLNEIRNWQPPTLQACYQQQLLEHQHQKHGAQELLIVAC